VKHRPNTFASDGNQPKYSMQQKTSVDYIRYAGVTAIIASIAATAVHFKLFRNNKKSTSGKKESKKTYIACDEDSDISFPWEPKKFGKTIPFKQIENEPISKHKDTSNLSTEHQLNFIASMSFANGNLNVACPCCQ